ncbi:MULTISPECIES: KTSC domain-containing protein [unclassified Methanobrevibacter]|jgi:hypothetical protein|uniref:KTSC domain-containing protein n=1 Tax=unclassified Methanobrevibacter TaxID=2638681 RepID=UPI0039B9790E
MERSPIESKDLCAVGYDENSKVLEVELKDGDVYHFARVPVKVHTKLMNVDDKETYFDRYVKNNYPHRKI